MRLNVGDRVRCAATRFYGDGSDAHGKLFSERHKDAGHGEWCFGIVKRVNTRSFCWVLWDGDSTMLKSTVDHIEKIDSINDLPVPVIDNQVTTISKSNEAVDTDDDCGSSGAESEDDPRNEIGIGGECEVKGSKWKRVTSMGNCNRGQKEKKEMLLRRLAVNGRTSELNVFEELLPVSFADMLKIAVDQGKAVNDKTKFTELHIRTWMALFLGATQFKAGTGRRGRMRAG